MLVTQRDRDLGGTLQIVQQDGVIAATISGLPEANSGLLDVKLGPQFATDATIFFSYIESDASAPRVGRSADDMTVTPEGLNVASATLAQNPDGTAHLDNLQTIWRQSPKICTPYESGEFGGRLAFSPDGTHLFIAAGDRQELSPDLIQPLTTTIGKVVRIFPDGSIPPDNPFVSTAGALPEIWTLGHRNPYGLSFNHDGQLWEHEMGPQGGDEFNLITPGKNYGWPLVSNGTNYGDAPGVDTIPDHKPGDGFEAPAISWTPVIAPAGMIFYAGSAFSSWKNDAIICGLKSQALVRVRVTGTSAAEVQRIDMGARIRAIAEAADGSIWVIEDKPTGRLLRLDAQVAAS